MDTAKPFEDSSYLSESESKQKTWVAELAKQSNNKNIKQESVDETIKVAAQEV